VDDGRWIAAHHGSDIHERGVTFSADMSRAVWTVPAGFEESKLMVADLDAERVEPRWTGVVVKRQWRTMALSDDGTRVAVIEDGKVIAYDVDSGDLLAAAAMDDSFIPAMIRFESNDRILVLAVKSEKASNDSPSLRSHWKQYSFDLQARRLDGGAIDSPWRWVVPGWRSPFGYGLERWKTNGEARLRLVDPAGSGVVADLGEMPGRWTNVAIVDDGKIALLREQDDRYRIDVFGPGGEHLHEIDLPGGGWMRLGGEVSPRVLAVDRTTWTRDGDIPALLRTYLVDVDAGSISQVLDGVSPVLGGWRVETSAGAWEVGSMATRVMIDEGFSLSLLDTETGELRRLVPFSD
jgi:hypothetical protein